MIKEGAAGRIIPAAAAGIISGVRSVIAVVSFATLIFAGPLAEHLGAGVGLALLSAFVLGLLMALLSSYKGAVAIPQDITSAILALVAASMVKEFSHSVSSESIFHTVLIVLALTSGLTGVVFLLLGSLKLGGFIRYIPFPVVGGVVAGSGFLLIQGAVRVMTAGKADLTDVGALFIPATMQAWLPGVLFALVLFAITRKTRHYLVLPGMLFGAIAFFYLVISLTGTSIVEARSAGLLLGPFPKEALWAPVTFKTFASADMHAIWSALPDIGTIILVSVVALLLYASGMELIIARDLDLDRELRSAGLANLAIAGFGGIVGFHALSLSALSHRMKADSRWVGIISASICGLTLYWGVAIVSFFPIPVLGGLLLYLGLEFIYEWVIAARKKLAGGEYAIIIIILAVVAAVGFLEGIIVGILAGIILFVVKYSRIDVVKYEVDGACCHSNVDRPAQHRRLLQEKGSRILVLKLQGYLFFGTADSLLKKLRQKIIAEDNGAPRFVLLDFRLVSGLDSSAVMSFIRINQLAAANNFSVGLAGAPEDILRQLQTSGFPVEENGSVFFFKDLDRGLEHFENSILMLDDACRESECETLLDRLNRELGFESEVDEFMQFLEKLEAEAGLVLMRQHDESDDMFFIESGSVTAKLNLGDDKSFRLRTMGPGTVVGEIGFYLGVPRTASVVADEQVTYYRLSRIKMKNMESQAPHIAAAFHEFMVRLLAERLADTNKLLHSVLD